MLGYLSLSIICLPMLSVRHIWGIRLHPGTQTIGQNPEDVAALCSLKLKVLFASQTDNVHRQMSIFMLQMGATVYIFHSSMANQIYSFKTEHSMYLLKDYHKMENRTKATYKTSST